jgi:hypothetical protein
LITQPDVLEQILVRLNLLVMLALDNALPGSETTTTSKVQRLLALGLQPAEVASIVGKPVNYVTAITANARAAAKKKENRSG